MPRSFIQVKCLLISPGDVGQERQAVILAVEDFNAHAGETLNSQVKVVRWDLHSQPDLSKPPQDVLNEQIVDNCDFAVAIFWSRVGTPTRNYRSGSVEEVDRVLSNNKRVLVYFCTRDVPRDAQLDEIRQLHEEYSKRGLIKEFDTADSLRAFLARDLSAVVPKLLEQPISQLPKPDVRVVAEFGKVIELSRQQRAFPAFRASIQNHSLRDFFLAQVGLEGKGMWVTNSGDALGRAIDANRIIAPGDSYTVLLDAENLVKAPLTNCVVIDKIGRKFMPPEGAFIQSYERWNRWLSANQTVSWKSFSHRSGYCFLPVEQILDSEASGGPEK